MKKIFIVLCCAALSLAGLFEIKLTAKTTENEPDRVLYETGDSYLKNGQYTRARMAFQTLLNTYPDSNIAPEAVTLLEAIENLEVHPPKVLIEARVVSASREFARELEYQFQFVKLQGKIVDLFLLDAAITSGESKGMAKLIHQPTVLVPANINANIDTVSHGEKLSFAVTPHVADEGDIILDLNITTTYKFPDSDQTSMNNTPTTRISTGVKAGDGHTIVLHGGIWEDTNNSEGREILFFITPRIIW